MHDKPLLKSAGDLLRRRHGSSHARPSGPDRFGLDSLLVGGFTAGTLTPDDEARLAEEVAAALPHQWDLPTKAIEQLSSVVDHLGGQKELMRWLDDHPGKPRRMARIYVLMGNLDQYSDDAAVVDAVRRAREQTPFPDGLRGYLSPATTDGTLAELASRIEGLLSEGHDDEATALALATTDWLQHAARDVPDAGAELHEVGDLMGHLHQDISEPDPRP
ncbi:hypothetical protein [Streptomyces mangrovisoli]|uniref:Uncharacterized protein n=1 Tax=Streptomyces mangrovisoli TaxID=1428628 RepID=A0A1J4NV22_9ACTN|nr:hypothetical protein [Streptomyces mangrovisoli]OIJ64982.1 hypothetical protein WN71_026240 [Streptomyces mangrovisoli]